jgi:cysteine desulfurase
MLPYFHDQYGNPSSVYSVARATKQAIDDAREAVAAVLGAASPGEVYFTGCGTESDNWAIKGAAYANRARGKHIVTTAIEHHAVLETCAFLEKQGFEVTYLPVDGDGLVSVEEARAAIRQDTVLVSVMTANNEIGTVEPVAEIARAAHEKGALFHTDAVQAAGTLDIRASETGADMISISAHKFYGPKGVGALYVRKGTRLERFMNGGGQERGRRAGTENVAGIVGLAAALTRAWEGREASNARLAAMRDRAVKGLLERVPHSRLNGHPTRRLANNANLCFRYIEGESMLLMLDMKGFGASSGSACTSGSLDPSHVLLAIGLPHEVAHGSLRLTFGEDNTEQDVDDLLEALPPIVARLREMSPLYEDFVKNGAGA